MAYLSYEDARAAIDHAPKGEWHLTAYTGGKTDLAYLKHYVVTQAAKMYGVSASVFDTATVFSTTLLRDFVNRAVYDKSDAHFENVNAQAMRSDVAAALHGKYDSCGLMGYQLWRVYESMGYDTTRIGAIDGEYIPGTKDKYTFFDAHVLTEVYLQDLGKYALQCATFNTLFADASGTPLSYNELRIADQKGHGAFDLYQTDGYLPFPTTGHSVYELPGSTWPSYVVDELRTDWTKVLYSWDTSSGYVGTIAALVSPSGSGAYASRGAAVQALAAAEKTGDGWVDGAAQIRATHHFVGGFEIYSPDSGKIVGQWLTVYLGSGHYIARDHITGTVLNGSLDQLVSEAAGAGRVLNPGVDLSQFLYPIAILGRYGTIAYDPEAEHFRSVLPTVMGTSHADSLHAVISGPELLEGLGGSDFYYVNSSLDHVLEGAGGGTDRIFSSVNYTLSPNTRVEYLETNSQAGTADINLTGNKFNNVLVGNNGDNMLNGGLGVDKMFGGRGDDTYYVDNAHDTVNELPGRDFDRVYTDVSYKLASTTDVEFLAAINSAATTVINLTGNKYNNTLIGNDGNNTLNGGAGYDVMKGLGGNDAYIVDSSHDKVIEALGDGWDTVSTSVSYKLSGGEIELLRAAAGTNPINLTGNDFANWVVGNAGNNTLNGEGGNDTLVGGGGQDTMNGGAGADNFVFKAPIDGANNIVTVTDFNVSEDHIWLDQSIFGALTPGTLAASEFHEGASASSASDRIVYDSSNGYLYYDPDGNAGGGQLQVQFAHLATGLSLSLTHSQFLVV